jgi:hypothetical protein
MPFVGVAARTDYAWRYRQRHSTFESTSKIATIPSELRNLG